MAVVGAHHGIEVIAAITVTIDRVPTPSRWLFISCILGLTIGGIYLPLQVGRFPQLSVTGVELSSTQTSEWKAGRTAISA
jgi:hypothetical protein